MKVGDLVRLTSNPKQGVGIILEKTAMSNDGETYFRYRIMWANGRCTIGGKHYVEVINESR